ncbi:MAG TPA: 16S rRNA (guanine(527)-N(7))-methyltransferase RsmG [Albitalea sp.]|nr:16S rRNA (guanine(527)-N(7))-methyltransferase RsmG [Albitalea sp.]
MNEPRMASAADLAAATQHLGLQLDTSTVERLLAYLGLLQRWNATYNLTAVRDPSQMLAQHLLDCLAVVGPLRRHLGTRRARILDVGSGGGLPGAVIAIVCPDWEVCCVDAVGKKVAFIRQTAMELKLANLVGAHARVEKLAAGIFDVITSRAFASLADFTALTRRHLANGGVWMAMKGRQPQDELLALPPDVDVFHVEQLDVPGLDAQRCLIWMRPRADQ